MDDEQLRDKLLNAMLENERLANENSELEAKIESLQDELMDYKLNYQRLRVHIRNAVSAIDEFSEEA